MSRNVNEVGNTASSAARASPRRAVDGAVRAMPEEATLPLLPFFCQIYGRPSCNSVEDLLVFETVYPP